GVQVYIDGKPSYLSSADLATFLRSMQSTEIEAIEIITNPSAKYDAAGNAGIINIRLKKDKRLGGNANINMGYQMGIHSKYNGALSFNYRDKKSNFFGSYNHTNGTWENWIDLYRIQSNTLFDGQSTIISDGAFNGGRFGWDYTLNEKSTFGVVVNGAHNNRNSRTISLTPITDLTTNELTSVLESGNLNDGGRTRLNTNVNYAWRNKKGISWNIDADFGIFRNDNDSQQPNIYYASDEQTIVDQRDYFSEAPTDINIFAAQVDHERKLADGSFSTGIKVSYVETDNTFNFYDVVNGQNLLDVDRSNNFVYQENINAAYASYSRKVDKWTVNLGLRAEQTNSTGILTAMKETDNAEVTRHYFDLFPSGGLTYQAHQKHQLRVNYSRRIDRPNYQDLNPFEFQLSELSFQRGNPFLQPQYTHNISFSHTYGYRLTTSIAYSYTQDFFANISDSSGVDRTFLQTINLDNQQVLSLTVSYPFSPTKWWNTYTNLNAYHKRNKADLGDGRVVNISANTATVYHQSTFTLPQDFSLEVSGWYSSPSIWGAVYDTEANFAIDMGVQKKFLEGRAIVKVAVTDVFHTAAWRGIQDFSGFFVEATGNWESTQLRVNFSYLIGNDQVKKSRKRKGALESELDRAGS
ncbi:MAG: outer membrane beta-barrel family protein, partial [Bacteroidota bacterium]